MGKNLNLGFRVREDQREALDELAHQRSRPGEQVRISDLLREATDEYLARRGYDVPAAPDPIDA